MRFKELGDELVASVKEGWDIISGKRDAESARLPRNPSDASKVANLDAHRDAGADRE